MSLKKQINDLAAAKTPFVFCINYDATDGFAHDISSLPDNIVFCFEGIIYGKAASRKTPAIIAKFSPSIESYNAKINQLKEKIASGDIYMANLTCQTKIELDGTLEDVFCSSRSAFKLLIKDKFVISSPEAFVDIEKNRIATYPMKGTAVFENDESIQCLLNSEKELAEHTMTVDLLRNDLSIVANGVKVESFRYPLIIDADGKKLIQTISKVTGILPEEDYALGDVLFALLPAGSITGTPKKKCAEILKKVEAYDRGFFCGIFGYFDGESLKSAVSIRYIEKTEDGYIYKSGGGITIESDAKAEYEEMARKVYLAF